MAGMMSIGLSWDGGKTRRAAILLVSFCLVVMLFTAFAPTAGATMDTYQAAPAGGVYAMSFDYWGGSFDYPWFPSGASYSRLGVSWS